MCARVHVCVRVHVRVHVKTNGTSIHGREMVKCNERKRGIGKTSREYVKIKVRNEG